MIGSFYGSEKSHQYVKDEAKTYNHRNSFHSSHRGGAIAGTVIYVRSQNDSSDTTPSDSKGTTLTSEGSPDEPSPGKTPDVENRSSSLVTDGITTSILEDSINAFR